MKRRQEDRKTKGERGKKKEIKRVLRKEKIKA